MKPKVPHPLSDLLPDLFLLGLPTSLVLKTSQKFVQESKSDFAKAIREQLDRIEAASSSSSKVQIAPDTPQSSKIGVLEQDQMSIASSDIEAFKEEPSTPKANKIHWELALPIVKTPPDLAIDNRPSALNQSRYNASLVYEWNIDGMSEYNILGLLQQMTMAANGYKTQPGTSDRAISEILIAGFTGQLKGWWDHLLTNQQQLDILNSIQVDENGVPIFDEFNNPIQDAVATLILTISLHFIGDPSHLRDKNAELLHNLRCRKLSEFQSYKTSFFTRLFLRDDANHITWKEKFLAGLPTLLGEKVRNSIKALYDNRIPYDELTYGELVSFVNKEGLKICQDLKLQKRLKWELKKSKQELGSFCKQFNYDPFKTSISKDCNGECSTKPRRRHYKSKNFRKPFRNFRELPYKKPSRPYKKPKFSKRKEFKAKLKTPFNYKEAICHKCGMKGHTANYCRMNKKLHELDLAEEILSKLAPLLVESSDSESSMSGDSDPYQVDELFDSDDSVSSSSESESDSYLKKINVLTKDQETFLELVKHISDPNLQKEYLDKLLKTLDFNKAETSKVPIVKKNSYDLTQILDKKKTKKTVPNIQDLQKEIKEIKCEIRDLKEKQKSDSDTIQLLLQKQLQDNSDNESNPDDGDDIKVENIESVPNDFVFVLKQITTRKYLVKVTLIFSDDFAMDAIALFDTGADLNCIREDIIPKRFHEKTRERLSAANNSKLNVSSKESATEDFDLEVRSCSMALKYSSSVLALANRDWALDFWVRKVCWALEASRVGCRRFLEESQSLIMLTVNFDCSSNFDHHLTLKDDLGLMGMKSEDNSDNESNPDDGDDIKVENIESVPNDFLFVLKQITTRKYLVKVTLIFSDDFAMDAIALFDTGADLNCIREDIVPKRFHEKTRERLSAANNSKLNVSSKDKDSAEGCKSIPVAILTKPKIDHKVLTMDPPICRTSSFSSSSSGKTRIKPLTKEGLDTSILAVLRDGRFISFDDSLLSSIESSLCKAMISAFSTQHKYQSKRDETLLLQTDLSKANTVIPKPIQWKDVNLPEEWILEGAAPTAIPKQLEPNTELQNVTQYSDDIPSTSIRSVDYTTNVPHPIYTSNQHVQSQEENEPSPPTSPTNISYPFKESNPITIRKKVPEWKLLDSDRTIESEHPPLRSVTVDHGEPPVQIRASPYKIPKPNDSEANLSSIIQQNNFSNTNLNTIEKQLTRIENQIQKSTITVPSTYPIPTKSDSDKKLKEPIFKPLQVSKTSQKLVQESKSDFAKAIREQLDRIEAASSSSSKVQIAPDTPQSSKIGVLEQDQMSIASSDIEAFKEEPSTPKANKIHWELALPTVKTPPDLAIDNRPSALNQSRYNASSVYEWNIDGMSEYNILGLLQQMTMAANAYKTQAGTSDRAISEILIAGFTGQLKGWWDHLLTNQQQLDILNSIQADENGVPILDEFNNPIQDAVATLILTISLHFIGDPSHLRDKNAELLHNLRCRKLSEFQCYKTSFFTRLFLRDDANHITWKEKFLAGLPTLLGEKVRNSIKALYDNRIPYDELTYGELVSFVNKEGLKICQDLKLQKRLKWELKKSKQELGSFCKQFNYDPFKTSISKDCNGECSTKPRRRHYKSKNFRKPFRNFRELPYKKPSRPYKKPKFSKRKEFRAKPKTPFNYKEAICHKCGMKGHTANYCRMNKKLHELDLAEEILSKLAPLLVESSNSESSMSGDSDPYQVDELFDSDDSVSSSSESESDSYLKKINVLTKDQETFLDL
ncbi:hypothetical protein KPL70_011429 [Citrus sinensis]|nr:hypothetical protein KPL70_011429 [Citrus sinensis]